MKSMNGCAVTIPSPESSSPQALCHWFVAKRDSRTIDFFFYRKNPAVQINRRLNANSSTFFCIQFLQCHPLTKESVDSGDEDAHQIDSFNTGCHDPLRLPLAKVTKYQERFKINGVRAFNACLETSGK